MRKRDEERRRQALNKLGFGFLHLPMKPDGAVNLDALNGMVDAFLAGGGTYFDTAYTYLNGASEWALRESLVRRHPRDSFRIATKLPGYMVQSRADCDRLFREQLERCGVTRFDVYMLHWLNEKNYRIAERFDEFGFLRALKAAGRADRIGFSYHDTAELLDEILTAHPETDCVLLQLNYLDWDSESIQSRRCYETAVRHGKRVIVMEPLKGGALANPPADARAQLASLDPLASPASFALQFAESLPGVEIVLSGMSEPRCVAENLADRAPLGEVELRALRAIAASINRATAVQCSGCGYCLKGCPRGLPIPSFFRLYNDIRRNPADGWKIAPAYEGLARRHGRASDCVGCGQCEAHCPQHLPVMAELKQVAEAFERA